MAMSDFLVIRLSAVISISAPPIVWLAPDFQNR